MQNLDVFGDRRTRGDLLAERIDGLIEERGLRPGELIGTKDELRVWSGNARATVNEAVRILSDRGRVVARPGPGGGLFVAQGSSLVSLGRSLLDVGGKAGYIRDVMAVRDHMEELVIREAVRHRTAADIDELRRIVGALEELSGRPAEFIAKIWELHARIAEITPNAVLSDLYGWLLGSMRSTVMGVRRPADQTEEYLQVRIRAHTTLVDVIESGDEELVPEALRIHSLAHG